MDNERPNFAVEADGMNGCVVRTSDPVDNEDVFATFPEARAALVDWFNAMASEYRKAASRARRLRKSDMDAACKPAEIEED